MSRPESGESLLAQASEDRLNSERGQFGVMRMVVAVLPAWPAFGFVREPASSWPERWIVGGLACCIRNRDRDRTCCDAASPTAAVRGRRRAHDQ